MTQNFRYANDNGVLVPSVKLSEMKMLRLHCEKLGLQRAEIVSSGGLAFATLVISMLGGRNRLNHKNLAQVFLN
eukprot:m.94138 g.94138  ORF g.94138 m.94138 type:complete len:74 (-) comp13428_c0_seq2:66-287(-)